MASIPQYVLNKSTLPQLKAAVEQVSLQIKEIGPRKSTAEGIEQAWNCFDHSGDLFSFGTCEVNNKNALALEEETVYLMVGPPARSRVRKDVSAAFERFEQTLVKLGAQQTA